MTSARLFRLVWRANGVLLLVALAAAALLALVGLGAALVDLLGDAAGDAAAAVAADGGERLVLGTAEPIPGTTAVLLPLASIAEGSSFSSASGDDEIRNLLFYDTATGAARWLLPDQRSVVVAHELLRDPGAPAPPPPDGDDARPVRWIRYELHDAAAEGETPFRIAISGPGGEDLGVVVEGIEQVLGYASSTRDRLVVFYRRAGEEHAAEVDLPTRKVRKQTTLPRR